MLVFTRLLDHAASGFRDVIQFPSSSPARGSLSRFRAFHVRDREATSLLYGVQEEGDVARCGTESDEPHHHISFRGPCLLGLGLGWSVSPFLGAPLLILEGRLQCLISNSRPQSRRLSRLPYC